MQRESFVGEQISKINLVNLSLKTALVSQVSHSQCAHVWN